MSRKPWPGDAIMVIAANAGEANLRNMEEIYPARCRDCGCAVHADTYSVRYAENLPIRYGRPIRFFCFACHRNYDMDSITEVYDHRE